MPELNFEQLTSKNIDQLAKQRDWSEKQKQQTEQLFADLEQLLSGRTYQQIWDDYDKQQTEEKKQKLEQIIAVVSKLINILEKNEFLDLGIITGETVDGQEIKFEIAKKLEEWRNFYDEHGVDWVDLPDEIKITKEQQKEMARVISELKPLKREDIEIIIVPAGLADSGEKYEKLQELMTKGYKSSLDENFKKDGGFTGLKNKTNELKIIITTKVQNLDYDEVFRQTLNKSMYDLEEENGIFEKIVLRGLDMMTYLILQRKYFKETGKHLDDEGWTWLPEMKLPKSGRVPIARLVFLKESNLEYFSLAPHNNFDFLGCRLAGSFKIKNK